MPAAIAEVPAVMAAAASATVPTVMEEAPPSKGAAASSTVPMAMEEAPASMEKAPASKGAAAVMEKAAATMEGAAASMEVAASAKAVAGVANQEPRFFQQPSDKYLLEHWLLPRVRFGTHHPCVHNEDVYSSSPAALTSQYTPVKSDDGNNAWYFFTVLRTKSSRGSRLNRSFDLDGVSWTWHSERSYRPVKSELRSGDLVGYNLNLSFCRRDVEAKESLIRTGWLMTELRLDRHQRNSLVLCKVYFTPRNKHKSVAARPRSPPLTCEPPLHEGTHPSQAPLWSVHPPDDQLLMRFLQPKLETRINLHQVADLYEMSPVALSHKYEPSTSSDGQLAWYFFTHVSPCVVAEPPTRGSWLLQVEPQEVTDSYGRIIGERRYFFFCEPIEGDAEDSEAIFLNWVMVDLRLSHARGAEVRLCKLYQRQKSFQISSGNDNQGKRCKSGPSKRRRREKSQKSSASFGTVSGSQGKGTVEITKSNSFANNCGLRAKDKSNMAIGRGFSDEDEEEVTRLSDPKDKSKEASQGPSKRRRQEKSQKSNASFGTVSGSPAKGTVEITKSNSYGHAGPNKRRRPEKSQKSSASFDTVSSIPGKGSVEITKSKLCLVHAAQSSMLVCIST